MDLTPKQSTPWWTLLKCCLPPAAANREEEEASDMPINDELRTPVVKRCTAIATPPTDKSTPLKQTDEEDESSHCTLSFLLDNDEFAGDDEFNIQSPSTPFQGTKVDYANGIGMFLTLAAAAQQASTIHQQQLGSGNRRSLFDDSFDLKEVVCEGTVCIT